jgi:hypothetical protein
LSGATQRRRLRCPRPQLSLKNDVADCLSDTSSGIYCKLRTADNNKRIDLEKDLFDPLIHAGAHISDDTRLAIQAYGGKGGAAILNIEIRFRFEGGPPGYAETTTLRDVRDFYGTTVLSYLVGKDGSNDCCLNIFEKNFPGSGGSGSIVYVGRPDDGSNPKTPEESCEAVLVIAGGGAGASVNDQYKAPAHVAISDTSGNASDPAGRDNGCGGKGGGAKHVSATGFRNSSDKASLAKYVGDWGRGNSGNGNTGGGAGGGYFGGSNNGQPQQSGGSFAKQSTAEPIPDIRQVRQAEIFIYLEQLP